MPDPKLIPIYDATVPIACTISSDEIPERIELVERMRSSLSSIERTPTGLLLHFPDEPNIRTDLSIFAVDEKRCCEFWGFDILDEPGGVALRWDGPPDTDDLLARLETYFTGDTAISALDGLL